VATDDDKPDEDHPTPSQVLAAELPKIRKRQGLSAEQLGNRVRFHGGQLDQASISKIENGVRGVSLDEAVQLAVALGISPIHLFIPREDGDFVRVTPTEYVTAATARRWIRGTTPLKGQDDRVYHTEVPESEWAARNSRVVAAHSEVEALRRRYRVARELASTITAELAELDQNHPATAIDAMSFRTSPTSAQRRRLETRLEVAYDQIAETKVDMDEAEMNLLTIQREIHGRW
jgi:transcriptional regulator with XRE-family HTH domain